MPYFVLVLVSILCSGCLIWGNQPESQLVVSKHSYHKDDTSWVNLPIQIYIRTRQFEKTLTNESFEKKLYQIFQTATSGELYARAELLDDNGAVIAICEQTFALNRDTRLSLSISVSKDDPLYGCYGCGGAYTTPVGHLESFAQEDSLSIVWATNSISNPVYY